MGSAIATLKNQGKEKKRFLILGDMKELGKDEISYHRELISYIADAAPNKLILCGELMHHLWLDLQNNPQFSQVKMAWMLTADDILAEINSWVENEDFVVVKGSNSMGLNRVITHFL